MKFFRISILLILSLTCISCAQKKAAVSFEAMNTFMTMQAYGKNCSQSLELAKNRILEIEKHISTTDSESDLYKLNLNSANGNSNNVPINPDLQLLTIYSLNISQQTQGAFNPALYPITKAWGFTTGNYQVPDQNLITQLLPLTDCSKIQLEWDAINLEPGMEMDFGALGKGYAGDQALSLLRENGITSALIDLGGNIQTLGSKPDGSDWNIGIKNPWDGTSAIAALKVCNKAIITSGGYERFFTASDGKQYIHIFDGTTGYPVNNGTSSVTIVTESGLYGDALSTALFVMGKEKAIEFWKEKRDFEFIIFTDSKDMIYTKGLEDKIHIIGNINSSAVIQ